MNKKDFKKKCVEYKGGKCVFCSFDKSLSSLCFHHINPANKKFKISAKSYFSWDIIKAELDKCILVCLNCHTEIHYNIITESEIKKII